MGTTAQVTTAATTAAAAAAAAATANASDETPHAQSAANRSCTSRNRQVAAAQHSTHTTRHTYMDKLKRE